MSDWASVSLFGESASMDKKRPKIRKTARIAPTIIREPHLLEIWIAIEGPGLQHLWTRALRWYGHALRAGHQANTVLVAADDLIFILCNV